MPLKKNIAANYAGLAYTTLIGIVILPFYLEFLGAEGYGLVGFFTLLHSWLTLLTAGISPAITRQVAHYRGIGKLGGQKFRVLFRSVELLVFGLAFATALGVGLSSSWLVTEWLTVKTIPLADVAYCIVLMGVMVGLRWGVALYAGSLAGMERQVWLNGFKMLFATLRFVVAYMLLRWVTHDPVHYFEFQLIVSVLEFAVVAYNFYVFQPAGTGQFKPGFAFSWHALREILPFALGITYTAMLWIATTQSDKLILSHVLTLAEYGYFALVVAISNGVLQFSGPINQAVLPRMTMLLSQGREPDMRALYSKTTQFIVVAATSVSGILALFSQQILFALTGNQEAANWGAPVLKWFAMGNGILSIVGMQYLLQYAHGKMRMHVINSTIIAAVQVPILVFVAWNYGAVNVAIAWFATLMITFLILPAVVHHKFAPGLHWGWIVKDILPPMMGAAVGLGLAHWVVTLVPELMTGRLQMAGVIAAAWFFVLLVSALSASSARGVLVRIVRRGKYA